MADSVTFKPHRGRTSVMTSTKKNIVLENGELFLEMPDSVTDDNQYKIKIGDGTTTYENLPYAVDVSSTEKYLDQDVTLSTEQDTVVIFTNAIITENSVIDVYTSQCDLGYTGLTVTNGSATITFPKQETAATVSVRLYVK